ncbi:MAG: hypothetical protein K8J31_13910 [Anaerolineae bacterium]|nr:hypothetical protein [Anaerolineae bacterium]
MIMQDIYWEQMMGYLGGVDTQIEAFSGIQSHKTVIIGSIHADQVANLYHKHAIAMDRLWELIEARVWDWEGFRGPLEDACDDLLRAFYSLQRSSRNRAIPHKLRVDRTTETVWQQEHSFTFPVEAVT